MGEQILNKTTQERIAEAALEVILDHGVRGATYRRVATIAQLSPGTMTYHYKTIDEVLLAAFEYMVIRIAAVFRKRLEDAGSVQGAREAVADLICGNIWASPRHLMLSFELYALASRKQAYLDVLQKWMAFSRESLHIHFDTETSWVLDAMIEGFTIHNFLNPTPMSRDKVLAVISKITN